MTIPSIKRKKYILEKIKSTNRVQGFDNRSEYLNTIEEVIDTENLTKWIFQDLQQLLPELNWTLQKSAYYRDNDERDDDGIRNNARVENKIEFSNPNAEKDNLSRFLDRYNQLNIFCRDGVIRVQCAAAWSNRDEYLWYYSDLTRKDASDIANFLADHLLDSSRLNPQVKRVRNMMSNAENNARRYNEDLFNVTKDAIFNAIDSVKPKLPRGKQRLQHSDFKGNRNVRTVYVHYKPSFSEKAQVLCSFVVTDSGNSEAWLSCVSGDEKEEVDSLHITDWEDSVDELNDAINEFVTNNVVECFEEWYNNR